MHVSLAAQRVHSQLQSLRSEMLCPAAGAGGRAPRENAAMHAVAWHECAARARSAAGQDVVAVATVREGRKLRRVRVVVAVGVGQRAAVLRLRSLAERARAARMRDQPQQAAAKGAAR